MSIDQRLLAQFSSMVSVATQRQPDLLQQAVGQLWHESPKTKKQRGSPAGKVGSRPNGGQLKASIREREQELREEPYRKKLAATRPEEDAKPYPVSCPQNHRAWMDWLGANEERWRSVVRSVRAGIRRHVDTR